MAPACASDVTQQGGSVRSSNLVPIVVSAGVFWAMACAGHPAASSTPTSAMPTARPPTPAVQSQAAAPSQAPGPARLDSVQVSRSLGLGNVLQIAAARGYFAEQGIDFKEQTFASTADAIPALATGQIDAGSTTPNASPST